MKLLTEMEMKHPFVIVSLITAGNRHKQNSWFCKEIRGNNFRFWWRRVHEDASQGMYMSKIEIFIFIYFIRTDLLKQENEKIDSL